MEHTRDRRLVADGGNPEGGDADDGNADDDGTTGGEPSGGRTDPSVEETDRTAVVRELYDAIPFHRSLELEVLVVTPRHAETKIPFADALVGNPDLQVLHGGIISSIVDLTGAAVFIGEHGDYTPTVDLRVNYLEAAGKQPLYATSTVERSGENIGVASVEVESGDTVCATGTGVYKLGN